MIIYCIFGQEISPCCSLHR